jgi:dihydrofolate reductase
MAKLIYITNTTLDGYIEDAAGAFGWTDPEPVHQFTTELIRPFGTYLYGRRLFETMAFWDGPVEGYPPHFRAFAEVWQAGQKIVYSRTLASATARNTRLERTFDVEAVRRLKQDSARDIGIGGAELAGVALEAGLVDECHLFINPVIVGGGKPAFRPGSRETLHLLETRRFDTGVVHVRYRVRGVSEP